MPIKANASAPDIATYSANLLHDDVVLGAQRKPEDSTEWAQQKTKKKISAGISAAYVNPVRGYSVRRTRNSSVIADQQGWKCLKHQQLLTFF